MMYQYRTKGPNPITFVGELKNKTLRIALARYGATTKAERRKYPFDESLGIHIAKDRLYSQPYAVIENVANVSAKRAFELACSTIESHIKMSSEWSYGVKKKRNEQERFVESSE